MLLRSLYAHIHAQRHISTRTQFLAQGHVEAARLFEQESGTSPGIELSSITGRMEVRRALQNGSVEEAIELVNDMNPEVRLLD